MAYTFKPTPQGTVEILQNGQRVSTGSVDYARSLGYQAETPPSLTGITTPITPESITPITPFQPVTPQVPPPTDISGLIEPLTLTSKEQEESDLNKRLQQINEQLTGKTTFEAEKRTEFGVSAAQQAFDDLNRQMRDLQRQQQLVPLTIQQESIGRGRTEAGIEPLEIGRRRALAYDALATASFIDAAQGRLASAERKVNEAIEQKFGPLEAQQRALMANLNLIRESPEASIQDKNRAVKQLAIEEARQKQNEENKAKAKQILDIANQTAAEMAKRGTLDAVVLNQIKNAPDDISALMIAAPYLKEEAKPTAVGTSIIDVEGKKLLINDITGETIKELGKVEPSLETSIVEVGGRKLLINVLTGETIKDLGAKGVISPAISSEFGNIVKSVSSVVSAKLGAQRGQDVQSAVSASLDSGNFVSAYNDIANGVGATLSGENATRFESARIDYQVMIGMREAIQEYASAGGNMGLLTGKTEDIERKLLGVKGAGSALAVQLLREFQTYRNIMTGAAFTPAESREYESVNPTLGKTLNLNLAVIEGALAQLENRITGTVESKVPGANKIYDKITGTGSDGLSDDEAYQEYLKSIQ